VQAQRVRNMKEAAMHHAVTIDPAATLGDVRELERWLSLATASAAIAYGISRRTVPGIFLALAALPVAYRGLVGEWPHSNNGRGLESDDTRMALGGGRGIHVYDSIRLEKPVDEMFRFWRRLENLPRVMSHLERVTELDGKRSHWLAQGAGGLNVEWDAEIINEIENKLIGWRSLPGADVVTAGSVSFAPIHGGRGTEVAVRLQYATPAGRAGALVATLMGREPSQMIRSDLRRAKQLLEAGEIARAVPDPGRTEQR
jgi:uncharacterized membrane protein